MIVVDATNQIAGRLATHVAKLALTGQTVSVVNCSKAVVTGKKDFILKKFEQHIHRGIPARGPFYPRQSDRIIKRMIRGMLPYKQSRGEEALKRVRCYSTVPASLQDKEMTRFENADVAKSSTVGHMKIETIAKQIGGSR